MLVEKQDIFTRWTQVIHNDQNGAPGKQANILVIFCSRFPRLQFQVLDILQYKYNILSIKNFWIILEQSGIVLDSDSSVT